MVRWSVVIPYYNEETFLAETLEALGAQSFGPFKLILVNNASTDRSEEIARSVMARYGAIETTFLYESCPGKIPALAAGLAAVDTPFVATCDADTYYPVHYLQNCDRLFDEAGSDCVGVMACDIYHPAETAQSIKRRRKIVFKSKLFSNQCHAGGYAQAFRTDALRSIGGFDRDLWPFVLEDHEIVHRLLHVGHTRYAVDHWCMPSERRTDRSCVNWTRTERLLYKFTPFWLKNWFFYNFLASRFSRRKLGYLNLREKSWA